MGDVLGNGNNTAYIYDRRGETQLLPLPRTTSVEWGRLNSEISAGKVIIPAADCTPKLADVRSWAHTLVVWRDVPGDPAERVWEGPIRRIQETDNALTITASDVLGWSERRAIGTTRLDSSSPVVTELNWSIGQAFAADDPNVLAFVDTVGVTGPNMSREVNAWTSYASEDIANIVGAGGRFTVVGRRTVLFADATILGRLPTLQPNKHLLSAITITEDGDSLATRAIARDDQGLNGRSGGVDAFYGLVDRLTSPGQGNFTRTALIRFAQATREQSYPAPVQIEVPDGAQLACDAPYPMRRLTPGVMIPLEHLTPTLRVLRASYTLAGVSVTQAAGEAEKVAITLAPISQAAVVV